MAIEPNPVLLYELRQAVRNRVVLVLLLGYLAALAIFLGAVLITDGRIIEKIDEFTGGTFGSWYGLNQKTQVAMNVLVVYYVFTSAALIAFALGRGVNDRRYENPIFYSPFPPWRLVLGKLLFGVVISLLFLSVTLPFLSVAYLLRGVDVRVIALAALLFFGVTQWHYFATVAFLAGAKSLARIYLCFLPLFTIHAILSMSMLGVPSLAYEMLHRPEAFWAFVVLALLFFILMFLAFLLSWVQYAPESSNRMLPVRVSLSVIQGVVSAAFLIGLVYYFYTGRDFNDSPFELVYLLFGVFVPAFFPIMICERAELSWRIRQTIPKTFLHRVLVFPFYTGVAGALVWMFGTVLLEGLLLFLALFCFPKSFLDASWEFSEIAHPFSYGLLCFDYCATTVILYNLLLHRRMSRQWNWLPLFVLLAIGPLFSVTWLLVEMLTPFSLSSWFNDRLKFENLCFMPFPVPLGSGDFARNQLMLALVWAAVVVPISANWVRKRFREFRSENGTGGFTPPARSSTCCPP